MNKREHIKLSENIILLQYQEKVNRLILFGIATHTASCGRDCIINFYENISMDKLVVL